MMEWMVQSIGRFIQVGFNGVIKTVGKTGAAIVSGIFTGGTSFLVAMGFLYSMASVEVPAEISGESLCSSP